MCLTPSDIYSSCCVTTLAMAFTAPGIVMQSYSAPSCWTSYTNSCSRLSLSTVSQGCLQTAGVKKHASTRPVTKRRPTMAAPGPGGGVLDRPAVLPGYDNKRSTVKKKPPMYRVMLHNDASNRREYVVRVLMKVVDGLTVDDAVNVMQEAHQNGMACVIECAQEDAERYCEGLRGNGLIASVEPAGGGGEGKPSD